MSWISDSDDINNSYFASITGSNYSTTIGKKYGGVDDMDDTLTYDFDIENQYFIFITNRKY